MDACYLADLWKPEPGKTPTTIMMSSSCRRHVAIYILCQEVAALKEANRCGYISRKRIASMYGDSVEDIDEKNALDQQRAMRLGLKYDVYPGLEGLDFNAILQSTMIEDELENLDGSGASYPGSIMSAGRPAKRVYRLRKYPGKFRDAIFITLISNDYFYVIWRIDGSNRSGTPGASDQPKEAVRCIS